MMRRAIRYILITAVVARFALADAARAVTVSVNLPSLPGTRIVTGRGAGFLNFLQNFYRLGLMVGGLLAFGAIVFGALKYTASAGNPEQQRDAKEWIRQALVGLLLLAGSALILTTLNSEAFGGPGGGIKLQLPPLPKLKPSL